VGTNPEHITSRDDDEQVTWIGRDRAGFDRLPPADPVAKPASPVGLPADPRTRWIALGVGVLAVLGAIVWATHRGGPAHVALADQQNIPLISVVTPGIRSVTSNVTFTGAVFARYDMPIGNDGDTGRIVAVYVEAGDHVQKGQLLARIDDSVLVPQVKRLEASLEQAQAQAALSAAEYQRALGVQAAGALSAEDIEKRRATAVTDAANVKVAAAQLAEQDLAQVKVGDPATVRLTGLPQSFEGQVRLLGAIIDPTTRLGEIRIALKPDTALRPGAFARGTVAVGSAQRPVVPQTAVLTDTQGSYVFIVNGQQHAERRAVRVADTSDAGVVIASGLDGSERVVVTAGGFLHDGETVKAAAATTPAG